MIQPSEREIMKKIAKDLSGLLIVATPATGEYYHNTLRSYRGRDRGLGALERWYLYVRGVWSVVMEEISEASYLFPYILKELEIINKLTKKIEEIGEMLKEISISGRRVAYPEEFSRALCNAQTLRIYMDYLVGRTYVSYKILDGWEVRKILEPIRRPLKAFQRKLIENNSSASVFYMGDPREYGVLTCIVISAYDNSLMSRLLNAKNNEEREDILKTYSPLQGLDQILFSTEEEMEKYARNSLRERRERRDLCLPKSLAQRVKIIDNGSKLDSYIREIYGENEKPLLYII